MTRSGGNQCTPHKEFVLYRSGGMGTQTKRGVRILPFGRKRKRNPNGEFRLYRFGRRGAQPKREVCTLPFLDGGERNPNGEFLLYRFGRKRGRNPNGEFLLYHFWTKREAQPKRGVSKLPFWANVSITLPFWAKGSATQTGSLYFTVLDERARNANGEFVLYHFRPPGAQRKLQLNVF